VETLHAACKVQIVGNKRLDRAACRRREQGRYLKPGMHTCKGCNPFKGGGRLEGTHKRGKGFSQEGSNLQSRS
jgi:hypothetical protein